MILSKIKKLKTKTNIYKQLQNVIYQRLKTNIYTQLQNVIYFLRF
jgi:hypothetical protein